MKATVIAGHDASPRQRPIRYQHIDGKASADPIVTYPVQSQRFMILKTSDAREKLLASNL
ncbi:hypothetical protein [Mesorhizobium sp. M4B.F.Ca.ET.049.02.1.2]|uniref:hypothetical protein n=1 Tax=Mesorhizobium sp. M4B.F.Ca.ET.049.02.1.2 TaxID=2496752 RepID=UPI0016751160|nr:hypothetical protein [Mesorhizobium sp. M4B.F.Ca.ET.049.02.1.2]